MKRILLLLLFIKIAQAQKYPHGKFSLCDAVRYEFSIPTTDSALVKEIAIQNKDVFVKKDFDLTKFDSVTVRARVWADGARLTTNIHFKEASRQFKAFLMMQQGSSLDGVIISGPDSSHKYLLGDTSAKQFSTGIFLNAKNISVSNCSVLNFGYCGLWMRFSEGAMIDKCYFEGMKLEGYGYGIWAQSNKFQNFAWVTNCIFDKCREAIGSSGANAWAVINCKFLEDCGGIERHNSSGALPQGRGGCGQIIDNCYFYNQAYRFPTPSCDTAHIIITNNHFTIDSTSTGIRYDATWPNFKPTMYNNEWHWRPTTTFNVDSIANNQIFVSFLQSADSFELSYGETSFTTFSCTRIIVPDGSLTLRVRSWTNGIPTLFASKKVVVGNVTSAYYKFISDTLDAFQLQFLIDNVIAAYWTPVQDEDWHSIVGPAIAGTHTVCLQAVALRATSAKAYFWIDDFDVSGKITNSTMETMPCASGGWGLLRATGENCTSYEAHTGEFAVCFKLVLPAAAGKKFGLYKKQIF